MSFVVTKNILPAAMAALEGRVASAVAKTAVDMQADAMERAPVDTGYLAGSGFARAVDRLTWMVGFTAEYALYVELGTSRMRAQPYLIPAWVAGKFRLTQALRRIGVFG